MKNWVDQGTALRVCSVYHIDCYIKHRWGTVWLSVWGEVQICIWPSWCHCHSLSLAAVNPDWFYLSGNQLTVVVPDKIQRSVKPL